MLLPATANRFQPALSVIQAGTYARERAMREEAQAGGVKLLGGMAQAAPTPPKDMQAINEYYFGLSITPMEAMFALVETAVGYLNDSSAKGATAIQSASRLAKNLKRKPACCVACSPVISSSSRRTPPMTTGNSR